MSLKKLKVLKDYEGFSVKNGEHWILKCCDCGLEHFVCMISLNNEIGVSMARAKQHRRRLKQILNYATRKGKTKGKGKALKVSESLKPLHQHTRHLGKGRKVK